jgi:hypothetical protein
MKYMMPEVPYHLHGKTDPILGVPKRGFPSNICGGVFPASTNAKRKSLPFTYLHSLLTHHMQAPSCKEYLQSKNPGQEKGLGS